MADPSLNLDTGNDTRRGPGRGSTASTPPWVKVSGTIAMVLVLLFVVMHFTGGGLGDHVPSGGPGGHTPPSSVIEHGVQQP